MKSSPAKVPDYSKLPLSALEKLEQVRDATISWILKEIEKAELDQASGKVESESPEAAREPNQMKSKPTNKDDELSRDDTL